MKYADRFRIETKWDILTPDPKSQQVAMRQSFKINWLDKPFGVWKIMDQILHDQFEKKSSNVQAWYKSINQEYISGLESELYAPPSEKPYWEQAV